jgi:hypothetical protein
MIILVAFYKVSYKEQLIFFLPLMDKSTSIATVYSVQPACAVCTFVQYIWHKMLHFLFHEIKVKKNNFLKTYETICNSK